MIQSKYESEIANSDYLIVANSLVVGYFFLQNHCEDILGVYLTPCQSVKKNHAVTEDTVYITPLEHEL